MKPRDKEIFIVRSTKYGNDSTMSSNLFTHFGSCFILNDNSCRCDKCNVKDMRYCGTVIFSGIVNFYLYETKK